MLNKPTAGERTFDIVNYLFLGLLSITTLYPFLYVLFASLSDPSSILQARGLLLAPSGFSLEAYKRVFDNPMIPQGYLNTLFYVILGTSLNVLMTAFAAYGLSRREVMWKNTIMFLIVFTMFFQGGLIPLYLMVSDLGLLDSRGALILPTMVSAYNLIIMRTAFQAVPAGLEESARIDGANDFTILFRVIIPLSLPVVAVMVLFYGVQHWNSWFHALIFLRNRELFPLQLVLREILIQNSTENMLTGVGGGDTQSVSETIKYATIIVATVPILALYPFLQKYFVNGVMIGAIKE